MNNPFESGQIKNYLLLYVSVVVIMVLFFVASTLFHDLQIHDEKIFDTNFTTKTDGMGLGLSMAMRYMRSTGGNIEIIESSPVGTNIKLTFPK